MQVISDTATFISLSYREVSTNWFGRVSFDILRALKIVVKLSGVRGAGGRLIERLCNADFFVTLLKR